jgi:hypothetical protein
MRFEEDTMNPKKQKEKQRRRARKLAEEAWEALHDGNLDLAVKIIRRAVETQADNPVLWNDQGVLLGMQEKDDDAEQSFRAALRLAPDFAEPYTHLASQRARQELYRDAVALQAKAVKHAPDSAEYVDRLETYRLLESQHGLTAWLPPKEEPVDVVNQPVTLPSTLPAGWRERLEARDWHELSETLTREGCALLPELLDAATCQTLAGMFDNDALFARNVIMDQENFGRGIYRYFRPPLPAVVDEVRRGVYPLVARIANGWQELLGKKEHYPLAWEEFRDQCHQAGQASPTPILLKYGPGGFNALHRDLRGRMFFPLQLAVVLSPRADQAPLPAEGFQGGQFLFCDVPEDAKSRRRALAAGLGDSVLFCTRDRLVPIGGVHGLQPVKHGMATITSGTRFALGVPFHEYR